MNKKIFKRLLIATGMIAPVVMVTPMLLTSCNDTNQSGGDQTQTDGNGITLVTFNSLLKEAKSFINPKNNVFWMNIDDSGQFYYNEDGNATEFGKFYEEILKNTSLNFLSSKGYKEVDYPSEGLTKDENISIYKKLIAKGDELLTLLDKTILSNFQIKNINQDISEEEKKNDHLGIEILGSKIDLSNLIEKNKVEVNSYIKLVNNKFPNTNEANLLHKSYNYEFVYSIKPKGDYYWKGVDSTNNKNKQTLEIRVSDYINDILFIDNLNNFKLENKTVNFTGEATGSTFGKDDTGKDITTSDELVTQMEKNLGDLDKTTNPNAPFFPVTSTANTDLRKVFEVFIQKTSDTDFSTKIIGKKPDNTDLKLNTSDISIDSLSEAFKKNRVEVNAKVEKDSTNNKVVTAKMNIKLNDTNNNLGYFSWLLKDKSVNSYTDAVIEFAFKWTFN